MKGMIAAILVFGVSVGVQGASVDLIETPRAPVQTAKVQTVCDETQCCKNDPYDGAQYCWPRTTSELNRTQTAVSECSVECRGAHEDYYDSCVDECKSKQQGSAQGAETITRFASSVRIGDPQPMCSTDAWACFHGTDDESPMVRDVGIFGVFASNHPCMHPSCD